MIRVLMCGPDAISGGVANHTKSLTEEFEKLNVVVIAHRFSGLIFKKMYLRTIGLILKAIKDRNEYDIIHVQASGGIFSFISALSGVLASKIINTTLIVTYHNSNIGCKFLFRFVIQNVDHLILVSNFQKKRILRNFPESSNIISVIPNGFRKNLFCKKDLLSCRKSLKLPVNKRIVLAIGNLLEVKGHRFLVDAMRIIDKKDILCIIVGDGPLKNGLIDEIESNHLSDRIKLVGLKFHSDIPIWMNACDFCVLPSLNEGNPTVMFEALGCGKPFVGTKVGGVPEVITSNEHYGLLVEPADPEDLAEKILTALNREWNQEEILQYAEQFTWENIAKKTINVYEQILR